MKKQNYGKMIADLRSTMFEISAVDYKQGDYIKAVDGRRLIYLGSYFKWFNIKVDEIFKRVMVFNASAIKPCHFYIIFNQEHRNDLSLCVCEDEKVQAEFVCCKGWLSQNDIENYFNDIKNTGDVWKLECWPADKEKGLQRIKARGAFQDFGMVEIGQTVLGAIKNIDETTPDTASKIRDYLFGTWNDELHEWEYIPLEAK